MATAIRNGLSSSLEGTGPVTESAAKLKEHGTYVHYFHKILGSLFNYDVADNAVPRKPFPPFKGCLLLPRSRS